MPSSRPEAKPPFSDSTPISALTTMVHQRWAHHLSNGGPKAYASLFPSQSERILDGILNGVNIDFIGDRETNRFGANIPVDPINIPKVSEAILKDVAAKKKAGPFDSQPFEFMAVSPIGAVPKKNSNKIRVIHHLSYPFHGDSVNEGIVDESLELSTFGDAVRAVRELGEGCYLVKLDVEAAYKQVPVRREDWPLLGFKWQDKWYYERVLPFGLRSSCRLWELYASALHHFFSTNIPCSGDRRIIHYVDDFLFVVDSEEAATQLRDDVLALCKELGIPMAADKTEGPTTCLIFLGIMIDTIAMRASLSPERLAEFTQLIDDWGRKKQASVKELQSLQGILNFACSVVRPGRCYLRRIIDHTKRVMQYAKSRTAQHALTGPIMDDIAWWKESLPLWNGVSLLYDKEWTDATYIELFTDACDSGYGARYGDEWFAGNWSQTTLDLAWRKSRLSMPFLELLALVTAAATWGSRWTRKKITFRSDCKPVVDNIASMSSRHPPTMHLLRTLSSIAIEHNFDFRCHHIPGVENVAADLLSRLGVNAISQPEYLQLCPHPNPLPTAIAHVQLYDPSSHRRPSPPPRDPTLSTRSRRRRELRTRSQRNSTSGTVAREE